MDFELSFVQSQLQESARRMLEDRLSTQQIREAEASSDGFPRGVWEEGVQLGWPAVSLPEELGGGGCGLLDLCVLLEEIGKGGATLPFVVSSGVSATLLQQSPDGPSRERWLAAIADGKIVGAAFVDEQGRNEWDPIAMRTNDDGLLHGKKVLVPFGSVADALLVTALDVDGNPVIIAVEHHADGVSIQRHDSNVGVPLSSVQFHGYRVLDECVIARGGDAVAALDAARKVGSLLSTAEALGWCETLIGMSSEYVTVRQAFGQSIGAFQAVAHPCADMRIHADTIRLLVHEAAWLMDNGSDASEEVASTKALANELFERLANDAFRVHGAIAYSNEYDLQLFTRRVQGFCHTWGETQDSLERAVQAIGI